MTKITLNDLSTISGNEQSAINLINANNAVIETASDNTLSRDGTSPNQMLSSLDMNSFRILNLPVPSSVLEPLRLQDLSDFIGSGTIVAGAPTNVSYLTLGTDASLSAERVLTAGAGITFTDAGAGGTLTVVAKAAVDLQSLKSTYSAVGDGVTDDTAVITTANTASGAKYVPTGTYATTLAPTDLDGPYWGNGQIRTGATNKRGRWFSAVKSNSAYTPTNEDGLSTAFNGDFSKSQFPVEHRITGVATLTQPTSGYIYSPWAYPHYTALDNTSGWNNGTADNTGRTAACAHRVNIKHTGQGDAVAFNGSLFVNSTKAGSTNFLANPAGVLFNGDVQAGQAGVYLNAGELGLNDSGFDVAGIGWVVNLNRSVATGAKSAWWAGFRSQSIGSADVNAAFSASGKYDVGIDLSNITTDANKAWGAIKADDRLYLNTSSSNGFYATSLGSVYLDYNSSSTALEFIGAAGGYVFDGPETILSSTAIPAGGTAGKGYKLSSTSNFGIFFGSGTPSLAAAKGSLYLRSDGAINARLYINTDGSTTWTAFNTTS